MCSKVYVKKLDKGDRNHGEIVDLTVKNSEHKVLSSAKPHADIADK